MSGPRGSVAGAGAGTGGVLGLTFPEQGLLFTVRGLLALVLLTPLMFLPDVVFPFVVGKALYARATIAVAFAAWAVLAVARPAWRPPRSVLLALLGVWIAVAALSAAFGVSPQRSLWSMYGRMQGLVDMAHWIAFAVVAAAVFRTAAQWRLLLLLSQAVGLAVAAQAIVQVHWPEWFGLVPLGKGAQTAGLMGNPGFLGAYLQAIVLLAGGLLWHAFAAPAAPKEPVRRGRRRPAPRPVPIPTVWPARGFHAVTLAAALWALALAGSMAAMAGVVAGIAAAAFLLGVAARERRVRITAFAAVVLLSVAVGGAGGALAWRAVQAPDAEPLFGVTLLKRLTRPYDLTVSAGARYDNWRAGVAAFADRPLLGWGPDNYLAASGRHLGPDAGRFQVSKGAANEGRDYAHNMIIEEAATKGVLGLAAYLALWGWTGVAAVRAVRRANAAGRAVAIGVAAALAGWFVQSQAWFYSPTAWLVHLFLLAFLAAREYPRAGMPGGADDASAPAPAIPWPRWLKNAVAAACVALSAGSLVANAGAYAGAAALYRAETGGTVRFMIELGEAIRAFEPMATQPRTLLIENVALNWAVLRERYPGEAFRLLTWIEEETPQALAAEPHNWQIHHALAHFYGAVAKTEPGFDGVAARFHASSLAVAPNLDPSLPLRHVREP